MATLEDQDTRGLHTDAGGRAVARPAGASEGPAVARAMAGVQRGDRTAFRELYDATSATVLGVLTKLLHDRALSEEVLVEAYAQAWSLRERYDANLGSPVAWLVTIARSRALDRLRARRRDRVVCPGGADWLHELLAPEAPLSHELERAETTERLEVALARLTPQQSRLVRAAFFSGLSHSEIAERERLPLGTVKSRIRTGLIQLRGLLADLATDFGGTPAAAEATSR
jgi:RNA polymerase sigma-70 factor (ECF subfamily)